MTFIQRCTRGPAAFFLADFFFGAALVLADPLVCRLVVMATVYALVSTSPMKFLKTIALIVLPILTLALGFQIGVRYEVRALSYQQQQLEDLFAISSGSGQTLEGDPEEQVDLTLLWSVWRLLQQQYIEPQDLVVDDMVFGAVSGLVQGVGDPYTIFMTPDDTKEFEDSMSGTLEGIGAQLDLQDGQVMVVSPIKGSPAEKAGLQPKDVIVEVNGQDVRDMQLEAVVSLIRGPKGTIVTLKVLRDDEDDFLTLTVRRESIHIPSVESSTLKTATGSIAVITVNQFGDDTVESVQKALEDTPKDAKGLVLDLRYNGGGYLEGAVDIVSMFVKSGNVVSVVRRDIAPKEHAVTGSPIVPDLPMVVLINGGSASASEITAGALKDLNRATLIGMQSFGKGTVQEIVGLPGGSALRVTVAKWLTPSGHDLAKKGITPDIVVDRTIEQYKAKIDPQMDAAALWLLSHRDVTAGSVK